MTLGPAHLRTVAFIGHEDENGIKRLAGTGFFVGVPAEVEGTVHLHVVTAAHVVSGGGHVFVRMRRFDELPPPGIQLEEGQFTESVADIPIHEWHRHSDADVALAALNDPDEQWAISVVTPDDFVRDSGPQPQLGEPVFFAGLLGQVPSMFETPTPMLRGGIIGALDQQGVPMLDPDGNVLRLSGHLVDCQSFGGFSGSPCFVEMLRAGEPTPRMGLPTTQKHTQLLGMVGGHFDYRTTFKAGADAIQIPASAGVAVVYPSWVIRELLESDAVREARS